MAATESPPLVAGSSVWDPGGAPERQKLVGKLTKCVFQQVFGAPVELFSGVEETSDDFTQHAGLQAPAARVHAFSWTSGFFNSFNSCPQNQDKTLQHAAADEEEGPSFPLGRLCRFQGLLGQEDAPKSPRMRSPQLNLLKSCNGCPQLLDEFVRAMLGLYNICAVCLLEVFFAS